MTRYLLIFIFLVSVTMLSACQQSVSQEAVSSKIDPEVIEKMNTQIPDEDEMNLEINPKLKLDIQKEAYDYTGILEDVTGGNAAGVVMVTYQDEMFKMQANFENLPKLEKNTFYEGWLVRKSPFHFISTGELVEENGEWVNYYASETNLLDHAMYVLTIEPTDDGPQGQADPAPAEHLLEGEILKLQLL